MDQLAVKDSLKLSADKNLLKALDKDGSRGLSRARLLVWRAHQDQQEKEVAGPQVRTNQ